MKLSGIAISVVGGLLILLNLFVIHTSDLDGNRIIRLISTSVFLLLMLYQGKFGVKLTGVLFLFLLSDILLFNYECYPAKIATFIIGVLSYLLLIWVVRPYLKKLRANFLQGLIFVGSLALNLYLLFSLVEMVPKKLDTGLLHFLFYLYGFAIILLIIAAISYSHRYANKASFYFASAALCLAFSDITSFIAYYMGFSEFYYPDRVFYLLGLSGLLAFSVQEEKGGRLSLMGNSDF